MECVFSDIYSRDAWSHGSGPGSTPAVTAPYRNFLEGFIQQNEIRTIVDLGCGDWQFSKLINWGDADYVGLDCVSTLIDRNNELYGRDKVRFIHRNALLEEEFPRRDLIIIKDVLQHWIDEDIHSLIPKLCSFRFVLFTNCRTDRNVELDQVGGFRPLNLALSPFFLPVANVCRWDSKDTQLLITQ